MSNVLSFSAKSTWSQSSKWSVSQRWIVVILDLRCSLHLLCSQSTLVALVTLPSQWWSLVHPPSPSPSPSPSHYSLLPPSLVLPLSHSALYSKSCLTSCTLPRANRTKEWEKFHRNLHPCHSTPKRDGGANPNFYQQGPFPKSPPHSSLESLPWEVGGVIGLGGCVVFSWNEGGQMPRWSLVIFCPPLICLLTRN